MEADWKIKRFADEGERVKKMPVEDEYKRISFAEIAKEVDEVPGIYEIWTQSEIPLKVGISKNLRKRLKQHAASRDSGLKGLDSNPEQPAQLTSKGSILAKHLYFDRVLTETKDYDLTTEVGRKTYLDKKCYIKIRVTKTRNKARELERPLEKSGKFRYARKVQIIEKWSRPVIFLDFDGVLHPADYLNFNTINGELVLASDARFCWAEYLWELIREFDCHLVIHSSWRNSYTLDQLRQLLPTELGKRVVAVTVGINRHESILAYVEANAVKSYIILDDAADEFPNECVELLLCHDNMGVSNPEIQNKLVQFLNHNANRQNFDSHRP